MAAEELVQEVQQAREQEQYDRDEAEQGVIDEMESDENSAGS